MGESDKGKKPYEKPEIKRHAIFEPPLGYLGLGGKGGRIKKTPIYETPYEV